MVKSHLVLGGTLLFGALIAVGNLDAANLNQRNLSRAESPRENSFPESTMAGPDVTVVFIGEGVGGGGSDIAAYGSSGGIYAFSAATTSCNIGNMNADWVSSTNRHPVIGQNLYRLQNGFMEQVGMSWVKHSFCAVSEPGCKNPNNPYIQTDDTPLACSSTPCSSLGVGCADTYWATLNGSYGDIGPRYQINAATGVFPASHPNPTGPTTIRGRLQVNGSDLLPTSGGSSASTRYFIEAQYVTIHDTEWGTDQNNASYIEVSVTNNTQRSMTRISQTFQALTALQGWTTIDPTVQLGTVMVPGDGRFDLASKVVDLGDGTWKYHYVLHNYNSHLSGSSFSVPIPSCIVIEPDSLRFRDVFYHSGDPFNGIDWAATTSSTEVRWDCTETFAQNNNANALRWGTSYTFGFVTSAPPVAGTVSVGLFRNGGSTSIATQVPDPNCPNCPGDVSPPGGDGQITISDISAVLAKFGPCPGCPEDFVPPGGDGHVSASDINAIISAYGSICD